MSKENIVKLIKAAILFSIIVCFRFYLEQPYLKLINPDVESIFDKPANMAAFIFGESRKTMAAYLWGKVLDYHTETSHAPEYGPRNDVQNKDKNHGAMYMVEGKQTLPILRLITWLDPQFTKAYDFGGYFLAINLKKPREGITFLQEGIKNNPDNYDLHQGLAFIYFELKNYDMAIKYAEKAYNIEKSIIINEIKTEDTEDTIKNKLINALRLMGHSYRKKGDLKKARQCFSLFLIVDPEFPEWEVKRLSNMSQED